MRCLFGGVLALAPLVACSSLAEPPGVRWQVGDDRAPAGPILDTAAEAAAAAGHPRLAERGAGRELRIWLGFGLQPFLTYVRIVEDAAGVQGELLAVWDEQPGATCGEATRDRTAGLPCGELRMSGQQVACVLAPTRVIDWAALLRSLERQHIRDLRDQSHLPDYQAAHDGMCVAVGLREGARWRRYMHCNPWYQRYDDARRAGAIADLLLDLVPAYIEAMPWDPPPVGEAPAVCRTAEAS